MAEGKSRDRPRRFYTIRASYGRPRKDWCPINLLGADLLAEVTLHLTAEGARKAIVSKLDDDTQHDVRQRLIQALIFTAIDLARERAIGINWGEVSKLHPFQGPGPAPPGPPCVPGG